MSNHEDRYLTVTQINKYIKYKLDNDDNLRLVYLKGEVSNFKDHSTGHLYFTVKDENSRILAVMFKNKAFNLKFKPQNGSKVLVIGRISAYEASGNYQIYVDDMLEDGVGNLYLEFEKLKKKLKAKGYFDEIYKKSIPKYPKKIGVITAPTGAAIRDVITTIDRRYKLVEIYIFPALVQGPNAKDMIVEQIKKADTYNLDTIILGRGGGSIEDLWPFNEEEVAEAVFAAETPIISAVGHEIDFAITDFVSDLRAPTPTAGAELAVPNTIDLINSIKQMELRSMKAIKNNLDFKQKNLNNILNSYIMKNPMNIYEIKTQKLDNLLEKLNIYISNVYKAKENKYLNILNKLETLNPLNTLKRGYSITKVNDKAISSIKDIKKEDIIETKLVDGLIKSKIITMEEQNG
jgi:exodeoxyribonuclease VII large subunit